MIFKILKCFKLLFSLQCLSRMWRLITSLGLRCSTEYVRDSVHDIHHDAMDAFESVAETVRDVVD